MPTCLSSLLHRTRIAVLAMLLVVLPLQGAAQLVAGIQGQRHLHTGASHQDTPLASVRGALRAVLDQLHAAQAPQLRHQQHAWLPSTGPATGLHEHGSVYHQHSHDTGDVLDVTDPADSSPQGGATVFQAWLPAGLAVPPAAAGHHPAIAEPGWRDRAVAPPRMPPRG
ncbi:MAG: hypothetical protein ACT6S0_02560 [Roseateles sp.]|uniref:hypothetical protein n=1 Tax=Roseateles sp. TaxID=1971397 RepID=UPI0040369308